VRANPAPWAAQQRSVTFQSEPGGQLFRDGATPGDVVQGQNGSRYLGDCWLMSSMASIAHTQPQLLEQAITDHGDGTYTVTLHRQGTDGSMQAEPIRVTGELPRTSDGRDAYAQRQDPKELWPALIEKAYASWKGGYGALDGGLPGDALTALTGRPSRDAFTDGQRPEALQQTLMQNQASGKPMVAASKGNLDLKVGGVVPGHAHSILGVAEEGGQTMVTLRDSFARYEPSNNGPRDGVFKLPMAEFIKRFQYFSWAETEAAPAGP
jgi:hypothetical protein